MNKGGPGGDNRGPRPDFNNRSFAKPRFEGNQGSAQGGADIKRQLEMINAKLDKLVSALSGGVAPKASVAKEGLKESVAEAVKSEVKTTSAKTKKSATKKVSKKK